VYHPLGEGEAAAFADNGHMTNILLLIETIILGSVATALVLLVHAVRRLA
jgi:hypothetical protein